MELTPKELMKQYVDSQNFTSTTQIMQAMKELFRDAIQQVMESELDVELGYEKSERMSDSENDNLSKNYRNGYSKKTVKTQLGEIEVKVPRDRNGEYEPKIMVNITAMQTVWKKRYYRVFPRFCVNSKMIIKTAQTL